MKKLYRTLRNQMILMGIGALYFLIFVILSINRHHTFRSNGADLGIFMQSLWTTIEREGFFYNTIEFQWHGIETHFGAHNSPILFMILPIYYILPSAETLLILQTSVIVISGYCLYLLANKILKDRKVSIMLMVFFLLNPAIHGINLFDFHVVPFAMPFIFLAPYYFEKKDYKRVLLISLIILSVKEDAAISLISLGGFYLLKDIKILEIPKYFRRKIGRKEKVAVVLIFLGILWIILSWKIIIPYFAKKSHYTFSYLYTSSCAYLLTYKLLYFLVINLSLAMLTFLRPKYTILLTTLAWLEIILSCLRTQVVVGFHYPYMLIPLSFIAIIYTLKEIPKEQARKILTIGTIVGITISILTTPALPPINDTIAKIPILRYPYEPITSHHKLLSEITDVLNNCSCSILTQNDIFPHLANRNNTYLIWSDMIGKNCTYLTDVLKIDVILIDSNLKWGKYNTVLLPRDFERYYIKVYWNDGIEIYVRKDKLNDIEIQKILKKIKDIDTHYKF